MKEHQLDYKIVCAWNDKREVEKQVKELLLLGYVPVSGFFVGPRDGEGNYCFFQPMYLNVFVAEGKA